VILASHSGAGWERGRFTIERKCTCPRKQRAAECVTAGWHVVASSDDLGDALAEVRRLTPHGDYRAVDTHIAPRSVDLAVFA